eukprot:16446331-Heterocapsa_arctica.AAC.1
MSLAGITALGDTTEGFAPRLPVGQALRVLDVPGDTDQTLVFGSQLGSIQLESGCDADDVTI